MLDWWWLLGVGGLGFLPYFRDMDGMFVLVVG